MSLERVPFFHVYYSDQNVLTDFIKIVKGYFATSFSVIIFQYLQDFCFFHIKPKRSHGNLTNKHVFTVLKHQNNRTVKKISYEKYISKLWKTYYI